MSAAFSLILPPSAAQEQAQIVPPLSEEEEDSSSGLPKSSQSNFQYIFQHLYGGFLMNGFNFLTPGAEMMLTGMTRFQIPVYLRASVSELYAAYGGHIRPEFNHLEDFLYVTWSVVHEDI